MGRSLPSVLITAALLLVTACTAPAPVAPERLSTIKSVGVISAIGDQFSFTSIGMTVFGEENAVIPIEPWGMDGYVDETLDAALGKRYAVKPVTMAGLGFVQGPLWSSRLYYIHAIYTLTVIDGRDFKVIASTYGKQPGADGVTDVSWPHREVDSSWWVANPSAMTERQRERLQDALKSIIASTGPDTLRAMKLID
jgi:hypothetical protein